MKTMLRVVNIALIALMAIVALGMLKDGVAQVIGASVWLVPPLLALRALQTPTAGRVRATLISNALAILLVLAIIVAAFRTELAVSFAMLIVSVPFPLNIWGVRRLAREARAAEAQVAAAEDEFPLLPESEAMETSLGGAEEIPASTAPAASVGAAQGVQPSAAPASSAGRRNYLIRHWRGELSLPVSYWINGSLITLCIYALLLGAGELIGNDVSVRTSAWFGLAAIALIVAVSVWSPVGIWRSAERHASRGGSPGWAKTAQVMIVLGLLGSVGTLNKTILPMLKEYSQLAIGYDKFGRINATVTSNGAAIVLKGGFGVGSAEDVRRLLDQAPGARTLVLDSGGGRIREAESIAQLARERELDTYVETHCESACTHIFMAGRDRAATPNARLGFHRPSFPGFEDAEMADATREMLASYRSAGISDGFLLRVESTKSNDMWYPTRDELIEGHVINRVSLGGEQAREASAYRSRSELALAFQSEELMQALEARIPGILDQAIDAAWKAHEEGGQDGEIYTVVRQIVAANYPKVFLLADDSTLGAFVELSVDQLTAAKQVSDEACARLTKGQLDVRQVLPKELVQREQRWLMKVLKSPAEAASTKDVSDEEVVKLLMPLITRMKPESWGVLAEPEKYQGQFTVICDASLDMFENLRTLPAETQAQIFRTMQAAGAE